MGHPGGQKENLMAEFTFSKQTQDRVVAISGELTAKKSTALFQDVARNLSRDTQRNLIIDLGKLSYLDTTGAVIICHLETVGKTIGFKTVSLTRLQPEHAKLIDLVRQTKAKEETGRKPAPLSFIEQKGEQVSSVLSETKEFISYTGEIAWALLQSAKNVKQIRWSETFRVAERAGVDALPIVALISFIVGLVMAFQAAIPMRMFGAELYVANLVGISMVRELGPLMTAIVLAGRSASAFAAEIGTMRINEEIDALTVMGLEPVRFLIVPRIIATTMMTPLLTIFSNLMGILGGALVITTMGYPIISYYNQIASFVEWNDFAGGLIKCFIFGILIASTGCIRGYQTGSGASAVGVSTTRAVVTSIVLIAVFDGIFSIIYYYLGI